MVQHFLVKHPVHIPDVHAAAGAVQKIIFASSNKTYKKRSCLIMYTVHTVHICLRASPLWWWGSRSSTPTSNCVSHSGGSSLNPLTEYNVPVSRSQPKKTRNVSALHVAKSLLLLLLFLEQKHHLRSLCGWCWGTGRSSRKAFPDVHGPSRNLGWGAGQTSGLYSVWQKQHSLKQRRHRVSNLQIWEFRCSLDKM